MAAPAALTALYTTGHSNHPLPRFLSLLSAHRIEALADVRSRPYSRHFPWFNRKRLAASLAEAGVEYVFMGDSLGGRPADPSCYVAGQVQYPLVARAAFFQEGIARLLELAGRHRVAVMCAEKDPLMCHRTLLIGRELARRHVDVQHILASGELESHTAAEARLIAEHKLDGLFASTNETIDEAYRRRADAAGFKQPGRKSSR